MNRRMAGESAAEVVSNRRGQRTDAQCIQGLLAEETGDNTPMNRYKGVVEGCPLDEYGRPVAGCCCLGGEAQDFCCSITENPDGSTFVRGQLENDGTAAALLCINHTLRVIARILAGDACAAAELGEDPEPEVRGLASAGTRRHGLAEARREDSNGSDRDALSEQDVGPDRTGPQVRSPLLSTGPFVLPEDGVLSVSLSNLTDNTRAYVIEAYDLSPSDGAVLNIGGTEFTRQVQLSPGGAQNISWNAIVPGGLPVELRVVPAGRVIATVFVTFKNGGTAVLFRPSDWYEA